MPLNKDTTILVPSSTIKSFLEAESVFRKWQLLT